jgi:hypothetical protein
LKRKEGFVKRKRSGEREREREREREESRVGGSGRTKEERRRISS